MNNILQLLAGYGSFTLGVSLYILSKIQEYKLLAKKNPDPNIQFSLKGFWADEWINLVRVMIAGIAIVLFLPAFVNGQSVQFVNTQGAVVGTVAIKLLLMPFYFLLGWSGTSGVFSLLGKYKKTLFNQVGVND